MGKIIICRNAEAPAVIHQILFAVQIPENPLADGVFHIRKTYIPQYTDRHGGLIRVGIRVPVIGIQGISKAAVLILVPGKGIRHVPAAPVFKKIIPETQLHLPGISVHPVLNFRQFIQCYQRGILLLFSAIIPWTSRQVL